jgi:GTP:adenosylcobinamide-phosphate guanylyltransferase
MDIVALIMAGGKGSRFSKSKEKPTAELLGKPLIRWVIEAAKEAWSISDIYVALTEQNVGTLEEATKAKVKTVFTDGVNYHADLKQAVLKAKLECPVLTLASDLPFLTGRFLDKVVSNYKKAGKPALIVLSTVESCQKFGVKPTSIYEYRGKLFSVSGINIINGKQIFDRKQQQEVMISNKLEAVFNVNTLYDLEMAKEIMKKRLTEK